MPAENEDSQRRPPSPGEKRATKAHAASEPPEASSVQSYLMYALSIPERALRTTSGVVGGAIRESAALLVPQAFQDSKTYEVLIRQTLDFLCEDVGGVECEQDDDAQPKMEGYVARKAVGNFVEMAGMATLHVSPMMLLAIVSDVAYGSQTYLKELADELKREGLIDPNSTIDHASDLLDAVKDVSATAASTFDTPPLSVDGMRDSINETREAVQRIDPTKVLPLPEIQRIWSDMRGVADQEDVSLLEVSSAVTLHSLGKMTTVGRGALSTVRVAGALLDRHVIDHYQSALSDIHTKGYYNTLAETSGPYVEAVWKNFSTDKPTVTEDLVSGKLLGQAARGVRRWLGYGQGASSEKGEAEKPTGESTGAAD